MLKMAMKIKARALDSEKRAAAAAAEVAAEAAAAAAALAEPREPPAPPKSRDPKKTTKNPKNLPRGAPPEKFLTEKEQRKLEKKLLEQRRKEEKKKEKERKKLEKMQKKQKKGSEAQEAARGPEGAAAAADEGAEEGAAGGGEGAGVGGTSRAWASWESDSGDEDDAYYIAPRVGGIVWRPGPRKAGALSAHLPLMVFLVFSVRSPSWVLNFLLQKPTEQGRGCGFVFGATCCCRLFLGCAAFSYWGGRARRGGRGRSGATGAFGSGQGARRRGRDERLI